MKGKIYISICIYINALIYGLVIASVVGGYSNFTFICLHLAGGLCLLVMFSTLIFILINVIKGDK